ncbi:murein hydrolase activator EnvC family protein [Dissulfurimicrobium hydrothermale]|uniref:murein hydrolase activator EnvC family protein n=1 Tax=Dissulfurimicrobium hydrothermale TaxID=1750598 RepID=UPI001EDA10FD|nr:peptidoglycan DD-metalloendopeptidase family protein [Dissulfurimicrobium hydrothermale]UKL12951.1 peptidoglycan DD-metalloendopeptidase family protein [Dissulfurimicrobium hydrothermale]
MMRLLALVLLSLAFFVVTEAGCEASDRNGNAVSKPSGNLALVQKEFAGQAKKVSELELKRQSILDELRRFDEKIVRQWTLIDSLKKKRTEMELRLLDIKNDYERQYMAFQDISRHIETRLRAISKVGAIGMLNILFSASTIPEMISYENYIKLILDHDRKIRDAYLLRLKRLYQTKKDMEDEEGLLVKTAKDIEAQTLLLETQRKERQAYLAQIEKQMEGHKALLRDIKKAAQSLQDIAAGPGQMGSASGRRVGIGEGKDAENYSFAAQRGELPLPVDGRIIMSDRNGGQRKMPGIIIQAPLGAEIRAVFDGRVVYCNELPGYGNVLIIDHGGGYYSLTAQGRFFRSVGDRVMEGDVIGVVDGGPLVSEGIYFELRHGRVQINPLKWLNVKN